VVVGVKDIDDAPTSSIWRGAWNFGHEWTF
jgi:hypothetical protein